MRIRKFEFMVKTQFHFLLSNDWTFLRSMLKSFVRVQHFPLFNQIAEDKIRSPRPKKKRFISRNENGL